MSNEANMKNDTKTRDNRDHESTKQITECEATYDELLSSAGEFGRYQMLLLLAAVPFYMSGAFVYFSQMFITESSPNHWCWIPELENLTAIDRRNLAIPKDDSAFGYSRCSAYVANWTKVLETGLMPDSKWESTSCQYGWEFNKTEIPYPTIASEQGWVCDKSSYQATAQSLFSVGSFIGGFFIGWIADRFGRIPAAVTSNLFGCIGGASSTFAPNFGLFALCRFIMGMAYDNCMIMVYLVVLEYMAPKYRSLLTNISFAISYSLFATTLPFIALALGHWKLISLFTSVPLALAVFTPLFVPESPRWFLSKGRIEETVKKVLTIGRINRKEVPPKLIEQFKISTSREKNEENVSLVDVFKSSVLRKVLILISLEYMCCNIVFDGLIRSVGQLDFDFFLSFAAVSLTEFPSMMLMAFVMDYFGRRWLIVAVMTISCVFSVLSAFVRSGIETVCFAVVARFAVNISITTAMQWAAEVLPTGVRGSGVSIVHICGCISTILTPYIAYLNVYVSWLPLVIIACTAGLGAAIALFLPETAKKELPHTFEDAEKLATSQRFWEMPCIRKRTISQTAEHVNPSFEM